MDKKYKDFWEKGRYLCSKCRTSLFSSLAKFDSGAPWPSFRRAFKGATEIKKDYTLGLQKNELRCKKCGQYLGHLFDDGRFTGDNHPKAGYRYCVLSKSLKFVKTAR